MEQEPKTPPTTTTTTPIPENGIPAASIHQLYPGSNMPPLRRRSLMFSLCLTLFLSALDVTIVSTALPTMITSLGGTASQYAWVGSAYTLASTSSSPLWAAVSEVSGRKSVLLAANAVFMMGSIVAATAKSIGALIGGRTLQGLGGGGMLVLVTIIIGDLFELKDRAKYYGLTGLVYAVASAVGPILGGVFTQTIGWQWCFWINLPFEALSLGVIIFVLHLETPQVNLKDGLLALDWGGLIAIIGGTICFLYGLESGSASDSWSSSPTAIGTIVAGVVLFALFILYESKVVTKAKIKPLIPLRIFSKTTNCAAFVTTCLHSFVFISFDYFLPLYFQVPLNLTPIISGVSLFALVIPLSAATMATGFYVRRSGGDFRSPIWLGAVLMTLGTGLFISLRGAGTEGKEEIDWHKVVLFQVIAGLGAGPLFQAPMIALQSHIEEPENIAPAMSALTFMRSLFSSCSIVIGNVLLQMKIGSTSLTRPEGSGKDEGLSTEALGTYMQGLRVMWGFYTAVCGVVLVAVCFIKTKKNKEGGDGEDVSRDSDGGEGEKESGV